MYIYDIEKNIYIIVYTYITQTPTHTKYPFEVRMFGFLKKKKAPPPKKVKKPVDIKKVSAQYKVVLKQERFRKDVTQIKKKKCG